MTAVRGDRCPAVLWAHGARARDGWVCTISNTRAHEQGQLPFLPLDRTRIQGPGWLSHGLSKRPARSQRDSADPPAPLRLGRPPRRAGCGSPGTSMGRAATPLVSGMAQGGQCRPGRAWPPWARARTWQVGSCNSGGPQAVSARGPCSSGHVTLGVENEAASYDRTISATGSLPE